MMIGKIAAGSIMGKGVGTWARWRKTPRGFEGRMAARRPIEARGAARAWGRRTPSAAETRDCHRLSLADDLAKETSHRVGK
jgi:hypothetical protein